jgi:hypothetical protein
MNSTQMTQIGQMLALCAADVNADFEIFRFAQNACTLRSTCDGASKGREKSLAAAKPPLNAPLSQRWRVMLNAVKHLIVQYGIANTVKHLIVQRKNPYSQSVPLIENEHTPPFTLIKTRSIRGKEQGGNVGIKETFEDKGFIAIYNGVRHADESQHPLSFQEVAGDTESSSLRNDGAIEICENPFNLCYLCANKIEN